MSRIAINSRESYSIMPIFQLSIDAPNKLLTIMSKVEKPSEIALVVRELLVSNPNVVYPDGSPAWTQHFVVDDVVGLDTAIIKPNRFNSLASPAQQGQSRKLNANEAQLIRSIYLGAEIARGRDNQWLVTSRVSRQPFIIRVNGKKSTWKAPDDLAVGIFSEDDTAAAMIHSRYLKRRTRTIKKVKKTRVGH